MLGPPERAGGIVASALRITDIDDPRIAEYRNVRDPQLLRQYGLFMAESREVVRVLLTASPFAARSLLVTPPALTGLAASLADSAAGIPIFLADRQVINQIVGFDIHRGCLAAGARGPARTVRDVLAGIPAGAGGLLVALDGVSNPDNIGTVFRNAVAFGASGVLLRSNCGDPLYRKAIRTSMGAALRLPFGIAADWVLALNEVRSHGFRIVAVTPDRDSELLSGVAVAGQARTLLVLGNEGDGISDATRALADAKVRIAMVDGIDSVNIATASGIAMHHFTAPTMGSPPDGRIG